MSFYTFSRQMLKEWARSQGHATANADSLFSQTYRGQMAHCKARHMAPISVAFKEQCGSELEFLLPLTIDSSHVSAEDGSIKFILKTRDDQKIETVLIVEKKRLTVCLSSQVGCIRGCRFCNTARMGLVRNLQTEEIVAQYMLVLEWAQKHSDNLPQLRDPLSSTGQILPLSNVVYMGMGEPLDNVEAVMDSISIFLDPLGLALAQRRVTVSTSGQLDGLDKLLQRFPQISLALSLHAAKDGLRTRLMPINETWNLEQIREKILEIEKFRPAREVLIQYTLIKGVNDSVESVENLATFLAGLKVKLNVIPFNEFGDSLFKRPSENDLWDFVNHFSSISPVRPLVRFSKAKDIGGACGQLVTSKKRSVVTV